MRNLEFCVSPRLRGDGAKLNPAWNDTEKNKIKSALVGQRRGNALEN